MSTLMSFYIAGKSNLKYRYSRNHKGDKFWRDSTEITKEEFTKAADFFLNNLKATKNS